jgi:hypothetical protein
MFQIPAGNGYGHQQHAEILLTLSSCSIIRSFLRSVDTDTARFCCSSSA